MAEVCLFITLFDQESDLYLSHSYPVYRATWEGEDSLGGNYRLVEDFMDNLKQEGIEDDLSSTLFLKEASDGGWNPDEPDVIPYDP